MKKKKCEIQSKQLRNTRERKNLTNMNWAKEHKLNKNKTNMKNKKKQYSITIKTNKKNTCKIQSKKISDAKRREQKENKFKNILITKRNKYEI